METHRRLEHLDISWNSLMPKQVKVLLEKIGSNRRLQHLNLSYNLIVDDKSKKKAQKALAGHLTTAIKRNKNLLHLDLTCTGLTPLVIMEIGLSLKRAGSLLSLHLSENPGLTPEILEAIP